MQVAFVLGALMTVEKQSALQPSNDLSPNSAPPPDTPELLITPSRGWVALRLGELWSYRELLYFLIWRDIKVRYKQTVLGASWAIIQPVLTMIVFTIFFGGLADLHPGAVPYPLFSFAALVPWTFFANGLTQSSNSLVGSANLIKKVYFPRLVVPIAAVLSGIVDLVLAAAVLLGLMAWFGYWPTANAIWLPAFLLLALVTSLGAGLWLSALNVEFRDVRYVVPFLTQLWLFASPIIYSSTTVPQPWRSIYGLNPMAGVIEGFRWALLGPGTGAPPDLMTGVSALAALALLVSGAFYFRRMERNFADIV
jgi:lipopolysaccharide transport system permease protein